MSFVKANGTYADGAIDIANNRIIINPEISGTRTREMVLIHELTHALYNKNGVLTVAAGLKYFSADEKEKIRQRYAKIGQGDAISVSDEINAHFAEQTLSNKHILERLVADKPTVKDRILSFLKKSATTYAEDERLSGAAKKLYKQYKKLFDSFVEENQHTNATEPLENDDAEMVSYIMSLIYNQRIGDMVNEETRQKLSDLYAKGYSILPRSIGDSIRYDGNDIEMNDAQKRRFMSIYSQANRYIEKLLASSGYGKLGEEKKAKAIKSIYYAFYYQAVSDLVGQDANNTLGELSRYIAIEKLAVVFSGLSEIMSDVDSKGNTISGSRKKKTIAYLLKQSLSDGERLLVMCYRGYSIQDGDYKGYTEQRAKIILLKYILSLKATQAEKAKIAAECGFSVKNGKIDRSSLYSGVGSLSKKNK